MGSPTRAACVCALGSPRAPGHAPDEFPGRLQSAVTELPGVTRALGTAASAGGGGMVPASAEHIDEVFTALAATARLELLEVRPEPSRSGGTAAPRTVRHRVIVTPRTAPGTAAPAGRDTETRTAELLPVRIAVGDRETLAVAVRLTEDTGFLLTDRRSGAAAEVAARFLDDWWPRARPCAPDTAAAANRVIAESPTEAAVLAGLAQGLTDESVARRVGVTPRTVRRHVAAVSARFGASSRLQLGILIGRTAGSTAAGPAGSPDPAPGHG
ncbi:helix-turn-helix transcriptional regulator [Streptomyces sp. TRM 70361]|uniref:helix-turn-helix transcriptional regulator n=1 Tax=Streptomyces sp. TRM 70361 TaxID=3116553 RepID=UPI002E7BE6B7|nr:helix-turn-helix transcriptional regulator [Streptomyces sp. TRM 70361]MEE1940890.1 helix-turn-helix transcriptional regulator [Streptomyces sp. TRM 70361]